MKTFRSISDSSQFGSVIILNILERVDLCDDLAVKLQQFIYSVMREK